MKSHVYFYKLLYLPLGFILLVTLPLSAQNFNGGMFGGLSASEVSGDNISGPNKLGFNIGLYTGYNLNDNTSLQMEMMYIQKGSKKNPSERNGFTAYRFHLEYIEVPVLLKFAPKSFRQIQFIGNMKYETGFSYSRLMRYKEEDNYRLVLPGEKEDYNVNEVNLILGMYYPLGEKLNFNFRLNNSVTPIRPHKGRARTWYNWGQYHTVWTLNLTYSFNK